jgi:hypothetical protein
MDAGTHGARKIAGAGIMMPPIDAIGHCTRCTTPCVCACQLLVALEPDAPFAYRLQASPHHFAWAGLPDQPPSPQLPILICHRYKRGPQYPRPAAGPSAKLRKLQTPVLLLIMSSVSQKSHTTLLAPHPCTQCHQYRSLSQTGGGGTTMYIHVHVHTLMRRGISVHH